MAPAQPAIPASISGTLILGSDNPPVTLLLFTNHDCNYCKEFQQTLLPRLQTDYIATNKLRMMIVPVPLRKYAQSDTKAHALICGVRAGSGSDVNQMLFEGRSNFPVLKECLSDNDYLQSVMARQQEVISALDVTLVPTYYLNQTRFTGLPSYADLRGQIEHILEND